MSQELNHWADIVVVVVYFLFVIAVTIWSVYRHSRGNVQGYFLAGRDMLWWAVGASLFSSNIGSEHFIGLAGSGAASGISMAVYEFGSPVLWVLMSWFFYPVYFTAGVSTLPEYLEKRFGGRRIRMYISGLSLVLYIVTKLAVSIYAGSLFIQLALGWDMYLSIAILLVVTGVYTVIGGLRAVMYTDTLQTVIMVIGAVVLMIISFVKIGGYDNLVEAYMRAIPSVRDNSSTCGLPRKDAFHLIRDPVKSDNPWPGLMLNSTIGVMWYVCTDQVMVQRVLAAKNIKHAKGGAILVSYIKMLPLFTIVFPGMIARALYPDEVGCVDPAECSRVCGNPVGCSNIAYPKLVLALLPVGLRGLLMAAMMSAIMSSLTSVFNSASALFTMDLWHKIRKSASESELLIVGRVFIIILCGISILWLPLVKTSQSGQLFSYIQAVSLYLGTPIGATFTLAFLWKRTTEMGAFCGILAGNISGVIRMVIDFTHPAPACGEPDTRPLVLSAVHYTYFGTMLLFITTVVTIVVSCFTKPREEKQLAGVTWWTRYDVFKKSVAGSNDVPLAALQCDANAEETTRTVDKQPRNDESTEIKDENGQVKTSNEGQTKVMKVLTCICGLPTEIDTKPKQDDLPDIKSLDETTKMKWFLNINAVIVILHVIFFWAYFH